MNRNLAALLVASVLIGLAASSLMQEKSLFRQKHRSSARQGEEYRLPRHIIPSAYNIRLLPFIEVGNFTTHGEVQIHAHCIEEADNITLNVADIDLDLESITV